MNAVVIIGGKQYCVNEGEKISVEKIDKKIGDEVLFDKVLLLKKDKETLIGKPTVKGASIAAEIIRQGRGPKLIVFKKRRKKTYKKNAGHRQYLTELLIKKINMA